MGQFKQGLPKTEAVYKFTQAVGFQSTVKPPVKTQGVDPGSPFLGRSLSHAPIRNCRGKRPGVFQEAILRMAVVGRKNAPSPQGDKETIAFRKKGLHPGLPNADPMHRTVPLGNTSRRPAQRRPRPGDPATLQFHHSVLHNAADRTSFKVHHIHRRLPPVLFEHAN